MTKTSRSCGSLTCAYLAIALYIQMYFISTQDLSPSCCVGQIGQVLSTSIVSCVVVSSICRIFEHLALFVVA